MTTPRITVLQPDPAASLDRFTDWLTEAGAAVEVELMEAAATEPVFVGLESPLVVPEHHHDVITALPPGAELLAASKRYEVQALRLGSAVGVQFHPEASPETMATWTTQSGGDGDAMLAEMQDVDDRVSETGRRIARNFVTILTERH